MNLDPRSQKWPCELPCDASDASGMVGCVGRAGGVSSSPALGWKERGNYLILDLLSMANWKIKRLYLATKYHFATKHRVCHSGTVEPGWNDFVELLEARQDSGIVLLDHPPPTKREHAFSKWLEVVVSLTLGWNLHWHCRHPLKPHGLKLILVWSHHTCPIRGCPPHLCELKVIKLGGWEWKVQVIRWTWSQNGKQIHLKPTTTQTNKSCPSKQLSTSSNLLFQDKTQGLFCLTTHHPQSGSTLFRSGWKSWCLWHLVGICIGIADILWNLMVSNWSWCDHITPVQSEDALHTSLQPRILCSDAFRAGHWCGIRHEAETSFFEVPTAYCPP